MKKIIAILFAGCLLTAAPKLTKAQGLDFDTFLEAGLADANLLLESYLQPAFEGFGFGMNSGWYNTAKPHKFLGFDISASLSLARVPDSRQFFQLPAGLTNVSLTNPNDSRRLPTIFGPNLGADDLPELRFTNDSGEELIRISSPTGLGIDNELPFNGVPTPMVQLGVGLFKGTELKVRFVPEQTFDDGSVQLFGVGVMHDIKQYLPAEKLLPFDLSVFLGYTNLKASVDIDADANQSAEFEANAFLVQGVISKKILFFTAFAGLGYSNYDINFSMLGDYSTETTTFVDPVQLQYKDNGIRTNVGVRVKLLFLTLTGEYALQEYNTLTAGVGISIR
ncbi:DUF6588 family protein [Roseivirga misakiensis]|uniref:Uncharacterized protein n=1 Tax=Roseivirga misakiensis TaxID=1563681 RepID=A0A1E5T221_9BACT|nr:DUF6588 family protein [Roseivirga misakiensis]OEK05425.1 hypothetical protein BFP71_18735 [Roseivirga misakiensis]